MRRDKETGLYILSKREFDEIEETLGITEDIKEEEEIK